MNFSKLIMLAIIETTKFYVKLHIFYLNLILHIFEKNQETVNIIVKLLLNYLNNRMTRMKPTSCHSHKHRALHQVPQLLVQVP